MANERTYPCLPCGDLDQAITFYEALGFTRTYRHRVIASNRGNSSDYEITCGGKKTAALLSFG